VVDFRSDCALCCCRYAFAQSKHLLLTLRFRTVKTFVAAASLSLQKTFVAAASLSLQKTFVAAASLSLQKTFVAAATLALRFRTEQSFLGASDEPLRCRVSGQQMFFARKREAT